MYEAAPLFVFLRRLQNPCLIWPFGTCKCYDFHIRTVYIYIVANSLPCVHHHFCSTTIDLLHLVCTWANGIIECLWACWRLLRRYTHNGSYKKNTRASALEIGDRSLLGHWGSRRRRTRWIKKIENSRANTFARFAIIDWVKPHTSWWISFPFHSKIVIDGGFNPPTCTQRHKQKIINLFRIHQWQSNLIT